MRPRFAITRLCAVLLASCQVLFVGCGDEGKPAGGEARRPGVLVEVVRPTPAGHDSRPIQIAGTVQPFRRTPVAFTVGGRVAEVLVELGDPVEEGDALARLEPRDLKIAVREAKAAVQAARAGLAAAEGAGYELAGKELDRLEQLVDAGAATPLMLDQARAQKSVAKAQLLQAQAGLERARALKDRALAAASDAVLRAPFDSVVVHKAVEKGQTVGPGIPAFVLENVDQVRVLASVPAADLPLVDADAPVVVKVRDAGDVVFQGQIRALGWAGDPATGTFPVEVLVDNPDRALRSGMAAWVELARKPEADAESIFVVPLPAVVSRGDEPHVFVVEGTPTGRARRVPVSLHGFERDKARISGDLGPSSLLVVKGQHDLDDGAAARVAPQSEPAGGG
ncbi:MAG: efflux RND transporter periplasmic adaptor subunit [Deltaproteobacteria bacterium]|nr:efflux RND transporter periplasmic adaptor subunit [Deltaproteobacteria bacterium]